MSIGTLTVKANERVQQLGSVKQQLFQFLDRTLSQESSEAKKPRFASRNKPSDDFLQIYRGLNSDPGLVIDHAEPVLSLVPGAKVLKSIDEAKAAELQSTFSTLVADLGSRNPVVKTREAQSAVASALVILSMQPGEAIETAPQMASLRAGAKNLISSLIIKDPSENGKSSLDAAFRGDARKILIADNQTDFMEAVTAFAKRARLQKLDMDSPEFQAKLSIELGGGFSGMTLANVTVNRVKGLLATDPQVTAEKIQEHFPNNALMSRAVEAFQNEQIEQFKTGVIRSSYDRETNSKTLKYSEAGAEMQAVLNDKIHAWEGIIRATHNTASDGVDEITKLMQAYSRGIQYKTKVESLRDVSSGELSKLESFNRSTSTDSTVDIEIRKEYLDFNAKQAILFRLVENNFDAVAMANASKKTISEDDTKAYLRDLMSKASGDTVIHKAGNGSSFSFSKDELQKIINVEISKVSYKLGGVDSEASVTTLFTLIKEDLQHKENAKFQEALKGPNETLRLLTSFGGTDAASTNAAITRLDEAQLDTMFDQLGVFNLTLKTEDKVSRSGLNSFVTTLEKSYRTKNAELTGLAKYVHDMSVKADSILAVALEKNPSAVNKLFSLYSKKGDNNLLGMLAEHNVRGLAYETYKATIAGTQADEVLLKSNSAYETNLQSLLKSLNGNNQYHFNNSASIGSVDFKTYKEELETVLPEAQKSKLNERLDERFQSASQYPIYTDLIRNMAMKEFLFSALGVIARESSVDTKLKAEYAGMSPAKKQQDVFLHDFNELMSRLDRHHVSKGGQLALRNQFQEGMSPDTVAYRVLIADESNPFEQKEAEAKDLFTGILKAIFTPIMNTFFAVNAKNPNVVENFGTAFDTSASGLTEVVKVALNGLLPQSYQENSNP